MTKWRVRYCDICKKETHQRGDLIVKRKWYAWPDDSGWDRLDICADCAARLIRHIRREIGVEEWYQDR